MSLRRGYTLNSQDSIAGKENDFSPCYQKQTCPGALPAGIAESEREGTRAETRIGLSAKRTSPFKAAGGAVRSTTGSRGVRISRQDYWLPTPFASFPFTSPPVRHRVPSHSDSALQVALRSGIKRPERETYTTHMHLRCHWNLKIPDSPACQEAGLL